MTDGRLVQAVRNNALWCDTVFRSHGKAGEFYDSLWVNRHAAPRFYPNAVTLSEKAGRAEQMTRLRTLSDAGPAGSWAVKDSFCALDLTPLGLQELFKAEWIWRPVMPPPPAAAVPHLCWQQVLDETALATWESAWAGEGAVDQPRLFLPALLADPNVAFMAAYHDDRIVAGAIANRTGAVVGLSNLFVGEGEPALYWAGCVAAIAGRFPGCPLVGYEAGQALDQARQVGFVNIRALRVWTKLDH